MNTLNFPDVNVWLALLWNRHVHAERAREWFEGIADEQFLFCRLTQIAVLRLLTTQSVMKTDVKTMKQAWRVWSQIWVDDRIAFLDEPAGLDQEFQARSSAGTASPKIWADAYLSAFAAVAGLRFVAFACPLTLSRGSATHAAATTADC